MFTYTTILTRSPSVSFLPLLINSLGIYPIFLARRKFLFIYLFVCLFIIEFIGVALVNKIT